MIAPLAAMPRTAPKALQPAQARSAAAATASEPEADSGEAAALAARKQQFDFDMKERAELQRQAEVLDTLFLAQMKHQDDVLKSWLRSV